MYDPAGAEALLDAAGYERGADGIRLKMGMAYFEESTPEALTAREPAPSMTVALVMGSL